MNVLVIGGGGREHALAWKIAQSPRVAKVFVAPGNAGTAVEPALVNVAVTTIADLVALAQAEQIALTIVGPEAPLAAGIVDAFRVAGLRVFGPTQAAARLESSKDYAKAFMARHGIPTAAYRSFTAAAEAHAYVTERGAPIVVKADGLAAGKGVVVATRVDEAHAAIDAMLVSNGLGIHHNPTGARIVIEEHLAGEEASFIVMADGRNVLPLASSQDHKRLLDDDQGPNTGGMGAYSPAPIVTPAVHARIMREIILPAVQGMADEGTPYMGFLYAGVIIDAAGNPRTLEFNCRLGDPETQPILLRLESDLTTLCEAALGGRLDALSVQWDPRAALGVVMAAAGYPERVRQGDVIEGLERAAQLPGKIFHAGTRLEAGRVLTNGGRVLTATALGVSVGEAQRAAYALADTVRWSGVQYRRDIGHRAVERERLG